MMLGMSAMAERFIAIRNRLVDRPLRLPGSDQEGQGMVEYAFIIVLIALIVIVVVILLGNQVKNMYSNVAEGLAH
jgi:pilus assembly protein Flp/PilA